MVQPVIFLFLFMLSVTMVFGQERLELPLKTVDKVDLNRYVGLWYEIAKIPNRFQKKCDCGTTAEYGLQPDGSISVINTCVKSNGGLSRVKGIVRIVDEASGARLKVSFVNLLGWRLFWGDYWIIGLDEEYRWAIVGSPGRKYGWVLGRENKLPDMEMMKIEAILQQKGYDPKAFQLSKPCD